ncbi:hypothetical protein GMOD_00004768 [Pyrenophora seminiperda CCB06]|uniref:Uncharacterized protein n=1 Tax=Pyrenophora seminiperda CCB06 TaxID=1302712 RepID=A0A3M7MHF1_9PLEO|nr:hypothetical protein GMOD_00004768 [Pyrenophora seminiperda CCB06]
MHTEEQIPLPGAMQFNDQDMSLAFSDPQPRDGGAPIPSAIFKLSSMMLSMAGDEAQPRDGG